MSAISWIYLLAPHGGMLQWAVRTWFGLSLAWIDIYSVGGC